MVEMQSKSLAGLDRAGRQLKGGTSHIDPGNNRRTALFLSLLSLRPPTLSLCTKITMDEKDKLIERLRAENEGLRRQIQLLSNPLGQSPAASHPTSAASIATAAANPDKLDTQRSPSTKLTNAEISRFSRQLLVQDIGVKGQLGIKNASVLVVGAGGLGSPVILYLAAAGIGRIGIVDYDRVEESNLQRQVIHDEAKIGMSKSQSAKEAVHRLSSFCDCIAYDILLTSTNATEILRDYEIVVDATDNVATRYLLNDACVLGNKILVSGSALRMDGQLTTYNYKGGPCYRCIFPTPPPPETVTNCSDGGVVGVVTGIIGCIQALETIKIASGLGASFSQKMLLFDATLSTFRTVKLRGRRSDCAVCGDRPEIRALIDYVQFCGASPTDKTHSEKVLSLDERISCLEYSQSVRQHVKHILLDVREPVQFDICALPESLNIPWKHIDRRFGEIAELARQIQPSSPEETPIYVVCRLGNDSQLAVRYLRDHGYKNCWDLKDGLLKWAHEVDVEFPIY
ncbi:adenylyltransferase [Polychytrium aggregatum]|uniref:adenylyltransferase n=1 Tax=Polychytrium aggregatum TaxID=110093 RepID=UPI0022FF37BC|nr:adenylyltransferase [Polychytrium aggregatum]KAI9199640.1 adenylyltransferase [Polychytrium aggregatum]